MSRVIYVGSNGERSEVDVPDGQNLMMAATLHNVRGIVGDCGGVMGCATCHIIVEESPLVNLQPISEIENQLLGYTAAPRLPGSRLSCQLVMSGALDGITVRIADPQL